MTKLKDINEMPPLPACDASYNNGRFYGEQAMHNYARTYAAKLEADLHQVSENSDDISAHLKSALDQWKKWKAKTTALEAELAEWHKLKDPASLHVNLLRGIPAKLPARELLHIAGYTQHAVDDALAAVAGMRAQEPGLHVYQWRKVGCANWYDGHPDTEDGGGPYESRVLYAASCQASSASITTREAELAMKLGVAEGTLRFVATVCKDQAIVSAVQRTMGELKAAPAPVAEAMEPVIAAEWSVPTIMNAVRKYGSNMTNSEVLEALAKEDAALAQAGSKP